MLKFLTTLNSKLFFRCINFEPSFKLQWCCAQDLFVSQIPVTTGGFELQISYIRSSYLTQETRSLNPPVVTGICDPNKSQAWHRRCLNYFCKKIHFRCVTGSPLTTFFAFIYVLYEQQKNYMTIFWSSDSYYPAWTLPVQS